MIVDLLRNDLSRVCRLGSVEVTELAALETFANVHHLVSEVQGTLFPNRGAMDLLRATFPGGSITGATKLRAMEIIAALEEEGRGFSYGSLVLADTAGTVLANILIRTLLWRPRTDLGGRAGEVSFRVGGGIAWASDPGAEDEESLAKGEALALSLAGQVEESVGRADS